MKRLPSRAWWLSLLLAAGCTKPSAPPAPPASLADLNQALQTWLMVKAAPPTDVHELTNLPALQGRSLPAPPPGKRLAIDPARRQVVFVDQ